MDCDGESPPEPKPPNPTTVYSLGEDLLREVLLRLPSLATLVRAACTCRAWRSAISSCWPFRQRFRALHPSPLLGLFFDAGSGEVPSFTPSRGLDEDRLTAVRGGDFFLTSASSSNDAATVWEIQDSRCGYLLVANWDDGILGLFNPLSRNLVFLDPPPEDVEQDHRGYLYYLDLHLVISDEDPTRFFVISVCHDESRVAAAVFSSDAWAWTTLPWVEVTTQPHEDGAEWLQSGMRAAHELVCWASTSREYMVMLDVRKMEFTVANISLQDKFVIGDTKLGVPCVARPIGFTLMLKTVDSPKSATAANKIVQLEQEVRKIAENLPEDHRRLELLTIRDGLVYMATSELSHNHPSRCWFLTLNLETMKLEKLFHRTYDGTMYPYVMPWPCFMVGDHVRYWAIAMDVKKMNLANINIIDSTTT